MISRKILLIYVFVLSFSFVLPASAEQVQLKHFVPGSYQKLLKNKPDKPFMLVIWSTTCSSCMEKMTLLSDLTKIRPEVNIVMLATDDVSANDLIQTVLAKNELTNLEHWIFAEENAQKLRYEIDPKWYGELPRTYFLNKNHERHGISGALSSEDYKNIFRVLLN
ncbi:MAG: TlpA family protein disulfide reductase [Nitrosomonas sp.]|nr:TlpA family protein disulfide reductase [Nitrosomonas sp.]